MEVLEFIRQKDRMCEFYSGRTCTNDDSGETCPAMSIDCEITTDEPERLVAIVEQWAKEHPEEPAAATNHKNDEPCVKTIQDNLEGAIYRSIASNKTRIENLEYDVSVIRHNLAVLDDRIYALREEVDHTPTMEPSQTPEPKRTNKDVLVAVFPDAHMDNNGIPNVCPYELDEHHPCNSLIACAACKRAHWLAESEEN